MLIKVLNTMCEYAPDDSVMCLEPIDSLDQINVTYYCTRIAYHTGYHQAQVSNFDAIGYEVLATWYADAG